MNAIKNALLGLYGIIGLLIAAFGFVKLPYAEPLAKQHYRYAIGAILLLLLLTPVAFGLFILYFDANNFKTEIVHYVKDHTQRDLVLQGDIKVTFYPKLGLDSGKMLLSQRNSAREFAAVNNARLYIAWLPLLQRKLVFDHVEIDGARVNLVRFKDGTTNYDDLQIRDQTLAPVTFDIDSLRITNSSVNWQDEIKWQRVAVQDLKIETGRLADKVPGSLKASFHLNSEKLRSDSTIELKSSLLFDRKAGRYGFADIDGALAGTVAGFSNLELNFKGSLDIEPALQSLQAENLLLAGTGNYGQRSIEARLAADRLQYAQGTLNGSALTLDATLSQFGEKWKIAAQMPAPAFAGDVFKAADCSADFDFSGQEGSLQGKLSGPANMDFTGTPKLQLNPLSLEFSAKHPALSGELSGKATGSLAADLAERNANLAFKARIDDSAIAGTLAVNDFSHPAYRLGLNIDHIDLDRYIAADWIRRYQNDATHLDLGAIKDMNLNGSLHAGEIRVAKLKAGRVAAAIKIEQSELTLAPLTARFYGGVLSGSFSATAQGTPQLRLVQNLSGVQIDALLADTGAIGKLAGKGNIALDFSSQGASIGGLRKALNGSLSLALGRGSIAGIDLGAALVDGKDELGSKVAARVHEARFSERSGFSQLKAVFNVRDGVSRGNSFELKYPLYRVAGEGNIARASGTVDYRLNATVASGLKRRSAGDLAELSGVTVPVRVSGSWDAPSITLDFAAASGAVVSKRLAASKAASRPATPHKKRASKSRK